jgi:hypothetical protein
MKRSVLTRSMHQSRGALGDYFASPVPMARYTVSHEGATEAGKVGKSLQQRMGE